MASADATIDVSAPRVPEQCMTALHKSTSRDRGARRAHRLLKSATAVPSDRPNAGLVGFVIASAHSPPTNTPLPSDAAIVTVVLLVLPIDAPPTTFERPTLNVCGVVSHTLSSINGTVNEYVLRAG